MALRIRLARGGAKKRPFYRIVVAEVTAPRDGRFVERLGSYNPMLPSGDKGRIVLDRARVEHWLAHGAKPSERMHKIMAGLGMMDKPTIRPQPKKSAPGKKRLEREEAAKEAAAAPAPQPEAEAKPEAKETKPEAEVKETKPDNSSDAKADDSGDTNADAKPDDAGDAKAEAKPDDAGEAKPEAEAKPDNASEAKPNDAADTKTDASADDAKKD